MTRTAHHSHATPAFPVYTADWIADDKLILGGGGGASRSGIKNKLVSAVKVLVAAAMQLLYWTLYEHSDPILTT